MAKSSSALEDGLPKCDGPQLFPFRPKTTISKRPVIEFLERIQTGATAHVIKAKINGDIFALKIFVPMEVSPEFDARVRDIEARDRIDLGTFIGQTHPFYAECRAFGRLKEIDKERLAVRCYGYLDLSETDEEDLEKALGPFDWGHEEDREEGEPLHAIVKDFIPGAVMIRHSHAGTIVRNLKELHRCGILVNDVKEDMCVDGVIVDFSHALTLPHLLLDHELGFDPYEQGQQAVWNDLVALDDTFEYWNERAENKRKITIKVVPNVRYVSRLRGKEPGFHISNIQLFDPTKVDWQERYIGRMRATEAKTPCVVGKIRRKTPASTTARKKR